MSAILKYDFWKRKQLHFSEVNNLNYTKKTQIFHVTTTFPPRGAIIFYGIRGGMKKLGGS